ncbi:hypothetical protein [Gordonia tangerina]|uniref:Uncharacterized protein n=1 Tax=Gordonia tangerina TaxID=2911060 RepID=A0ABS9DS71_9ACTN|nr:hypothetical protein [Gordonia tangerina]MCF3941099.1 hypothetical protein [Gordonia tangerina]
MSDAEGTPPTNQTLQLDWMQWHPGDAHRADVEPPVEVDDPQAATTTSFAQPPVYRIFTPKPVEIAESDSATDVLRNAPTATGWSPPPRQAPDRFSRIVWSVVAVIVLVLAAATWALTVGPAKDWWVVDEAASGGSQSATVTACATPPTMTPRSASLTPDGLAVTVTAASSCADGDVLSNSAMQVAVSSSAGLVASGSFDFSSTPIALPVSESAGREITMTFPTGSYYGLPGSATAGLTVSLNPVGSTTTQELASSAVPVSVSPAQIYVPPGVDTEQAIAQALSAQADADRTEILTSGSDRWVAQLSSKQPGLVADGKVWTNQDILDEFASFYQRFSGARLLWSDEWPVFTSSGWWVSITSQTFPSGQAAVSWCAQQGFDRDHCLGKLISTTSGPAGTTVYLP